MNLTLIAAMDLNRGIGKDNDLVWRSKEDMAMFKRVTLNRPVIMGRKTFDSLGRPLPHRRNIVITRDPCWQREGVETAGSVNMAMRRVGQERAHIIGGAQIYEQALPLANRLILTVIHAEYECDAFFPEVDPETWRSIECTKNHTPDGIRFDFITFERRLQNE